jgi:predicted anti-sigma-YlaC factor YlaD
VADGEDTTWTIEDVRAHLAGCPDCTRWQLRAGRMDRLLGVGVLPDGPDLADSVLAMVRLPRRGRWRAHLRIAMVAVALFQVIIGLANMFAVAGMAMHTHVAHEEAAFDIAFGVAMLMVAWNNRRASSEIPVLATFVTLLALMSVFDLLDGEVSWGRLATHVPIVIGLGLAIALGRTPYADDGPAGRAASATGTGTLDRVLPAADAPVFVARRGDPAPPAARAS